MSNVVATYGKSFNITALFITHDKEDAFFLSNRIAIMHGGEILQVGSPKELYNKPKNLYCANFLGKINELFKNQFIRPEKIYLSTNSKYKAKINNITFYGSFYEINATFNNQEILINSLDCRLNIGDEIYFDYNKDDLIQIF